MELLHEIVASLGYIETSNMRFWFRYREEKCFKWTILLTDEDCEEVGELAYVDSLFTAFLEYFPDPILLVEGQEEDAATGETENNGDNEIDSLLMAHSPHFSPATRKTRNFEDPPIDSFAEVQGDFDSDSMEELVLQLEQEDVAFYNSVGARVCRDSIGITSTKSCYDDGKNELSKDMNFGDKKHVISAVKKYSILVAKREFVVNRSTSKVWEVSCARAGGKGSCKWKFRSAFWKRKGKWLISNCRASHSCMIGSNGSPYHRNIDCTFVAEEIISFIQEDPVLKPQFIQSTIKKNYEFGVSYKIAYNCWKRAIEMVYGKWEDSVRQLPYFLHVVRLSNPGSIVEWQNIDVIERKKMFKFVFWAFKPCIEAYQNCRPLICVDATHLYTKYRYKLLIAVTVDPSNKVLPLAFAFVDEESLESWQFFLENIATHIVQNQRFTCIISDRDAGIRSAIDHLLAFNEPYGCHRYCLRHLAVNFHEHNKKAGLIDLFWAACKATDVTKFDRIMENIRQEDSKAYTWLMEIDIRRWTLAHDGGARYGTLTTNQVEGFNGVIKGIRRLPPTAIVKATFMRCTKYFEERWLEAKEKDQEFKEFTEPAQEMLSKWDKKALNHNVKVYDRRQLTAAVYTRYKNGRNGKEHIVCLSQESCTCGKWKVHRIPCSHVIQACKIFGCDPREFVSQDVTVAALLKTYELQFQPMRQLDYTECAGYDLVNNPALRARRKKSRKG